MKEEAEEGNVFAEIAPISGHALITADGKMYTYTPEEGVRDGAGTHRGMFLQPAIMQSLGASIKRGWFDDSYPFPIVQERTLWLNRRYRAFSHFVTSVSPENFSVHTPPNSLHVTVLLISFYCILILNCTVSSSAISSAFRTCALRGSM